MSWRPIRRSFPSSRRRRPRVSWPSRSRGIRRSATRTRRGARKRRSRSPAVYTLPVRHAGERVVQHFPGVTQSANILANNALISPSLGRGLVGRPDGDRRGRRAAIAVSVRGASSTRPTSGSSKPFKMGGIAQLQGIFDIYNAFNARPVLASRRGTPARPAAPGCVQPARWSDGSLKFGVQFDF